VPHHAATRMPGQPSIMAGASQPAANPPAAPVAMDLAALELPDLVHLVKFAQKQKMAGVYGVWVEYLAVRLPASHAPDRVVLTLRQYRNCGPQSSTKTPRDIQKR
jgi:hypothetical protein